MIALALTRGASCTTEVEMLIQTKDRDRIIVSPTGAFYPKVIVQREGSSFYIEVNVPIHAEPSNILAFDGDALRLYSFDNAKAANRWVASNGNKYERLYFVQANGSVTPVMKEK
jgi:hypothetical protein